MDVKSSHEKPTWHGGEFYPELIRKSMFPSSLVMVHNMPIDFFFFLTGSHIFMYSFLICKCLFGFLF